MKIFPHSGLTAIAALALTLTAACGTSDSDGSKSDAATEVSSLAD